MKIYKQTISIHQFTAEDYEALVKADEILGQLYDLYNKDDVLASPNTGEVVQVNELPRVRGILDFIYSNRAVEVNPERGAIAPLFFLSRSFTGETSGVSIIVQFAQFFNSFFEYFAQRKISQNP